MSRWPLVPLRELTKPAVRPVSVEPNTSYPLLGVRTKGKGPFLRETRTGAEISAARLFRVAEGDFIYSRLFAWQGAFGVIPAEFGECYVSNEFPLFEVDHERLHTRYLNYWFRLPTTLRLVEKDCTGSTPLTRNRYKEQFFQALRIPLPPIKYQRAVVLELESTTDFLIDIESTVTAGQNGLKALLRTTFHQIIAGAPRVSLGSVCPLLRRPVTIDPFATYSELGVRSFGRGLFIKPPLRGSDLTWQKLFAIEAGDLVFSNIKAWEGAFAVARQCHDGMVGSHRYLTCVADRTRITPDFVWYFLQSPEGLAHVQEASPGSADRNRTLSQERLQAIKVPAPSLDAQLWFEELQTKAAQVSAAHAEAASEAGQLIPSLLHRAFAA